jgi:hypothetical protein
MPPTDVEHQVSLVTLNSKIEILLEKQEEVAKNINQIKEAIYNPEEGIFSRLRALELWKMTLLERIDERIAHSKIEDGEVRMTKVESSLAGLKKIQWMLIGAIISVLTAMLFRDFIS